MALFHNVYYNKIFKKVYVGRHPYESSKDARDGARESIEITDMQKDVIYVGPVEVSEFTVSEIGNYRSVDLPIGSTI